MNAKDESLKHLLRHMRDRKTILQAEYVEGESFYVSKHLNPIELAKSYHITADYLIEVSKEDEMEPIIVWPVIFLYRHAVELYLKQALQYINKPKKGHDISALYSSLQSELVDIEKQYGAEKKNISLLPDEPTFHSIMEFHSISPASTELRYDDIELIGGDSHPLVANYCHAQHHAKQVKDYFESLYPNLHRVGFSQQEK